MTNKLLLALLLAVPGPGAAHAAWSAGGGPCASAAAAVPAPEPARPAPLAAKRPVVISIVGVDFAELGIGKLELDYFKKIIEHFKPGHSLDENLFAAGISSIGEDAAMGEIYLNQPGEKLPDDYLDARLAEVLPGEKYEIVPLRWSRDPDESEAAVPVIETGIKTTF